MTVNVENELTIGLDLGTSGMKAVAVAETGEVIAHAHATYPTTRPEPGAAEQDAADWLRARDAVLADLARATDARRWRGIGLSAMLPTLVELGPMGDVVGPAITWQDGRADDEGARLVATFGGDELYRTTGQRVDGRYLLPMHARRRTQAQRGATIVAGAKDLLFAGLTGELLTDPSTATGYGAYNLGAHDWSDDILAAAGLDRSRVPPVSPSDTSRPVKDELAERWGCPLQTPVFLGAADSVLGALGLGVNEPGTVAYIAGTSTVILGCSADPRSDPRGRYLLTPLAGSGYGLEMDLMATGSAFSWLAALLGVHDGPPALLDLTAGGDLLSAPVFLPYVSPGEQGALWDPSLTGLVAGLTLDTTRSDLARALTAGIVVESLRCLDVLREATDDADGDVVVTGRSAASVDFLQALADASGRVVRSDPAEHDHSAVGAALLVWRALGRALPRAAQRGSSFTPHPAARDAWRERLATHDRLLAASQRARIARTEHA